MNRAELLAQLEKTITQLIEDQKDHYKKIFKDAAENEESLLEEYVETFIIAFEDDHERGLDFTSVEFIEYEVAKKILSELDY